MTKDNSIIIAPQKPECETIRVPVLKVFDGDGFLTKIHTREFTDGQSDQSELFTGNPSDQSEFQVAVRFAFIDAPEFGQPGSDEAKEFLATLIGNKWVDLEVRMKMDTGQIVDRHNRIVCVPFLTQEYAAVEFRTSSNCLHNAKTFGEPLLVTRNVELEMVLNGWAWVLTRYEPDDRYLEALHDAQRHKRGIWALENNIPPWEFKRQKYREMRLAAKTSTKCPMGCGGDLLNRIGKFGAFFGCSNFPDCRYSRSATV